jgi:DNA-binding MarR family transcriptional regulator
MTTIHNYNIALTQTFVRLQAMLGNSTPDALAARFTAVAHRWVSEGPSERTERARRKLLSSIVEKEPATLNDVAKTIGRGAPAVSRSVDALVRAGLVERTQDPNNRRRLALRLTSEGRDRLSTRIAGGASLKTRLERLAHSELRAVERAIEILERGA